MLPVALRPRSGLEIIDASVQLLRQHYGELVTVTALFMIPVIIARVLLAPDQALTASQLTGAGALGAAATMHGAWAMFAWGIISFVFGSMSTAAVVVIVSDSYLGREVTVGAAIGRVFERIWTVLGAVLLQGLIIGFGFLLLIIGAIIFSAWYFATVNVVMVEGKGVTASLRRSHELARGSVGRILGTVSLAVFMVWLFEFLVSIIAFVIFARFRSGAAAITLAPYVLGIFVLPFINVVITLLYYDLRIRKEGFDLELMAKEVGLALPGAAVTI